jgi:RNA polymerase sigma-70 factor, ECF subfamily
MVTKSYIKRVTLTSSDNLPPINSELPDWPFGRLSPLGVALMTCEYREIEAEIPRLRRYARALTHDAVIADDLVQDCLTRALGKLHLWQEGTDLRAWLFTILHNQYVNYIRRSAREGAAVRLTEREPMLARAPQQGKRLELRDLERAFAKLPDAQRAVILLVALEGMRYDEVAAVLDVPVGTIRSRLSRGREALRRLTGSVPDEEAHPIMKPDQLRYAIPRLKGASSRSEIGRAHLPSRRRARRASQELSATEPAIA